jgi:CheY-like chemotaxis protein
MPVTRLRGKAVLCIGNDLVNLNLRCALLREHGWLVLSSGSGHDGVTRFGQEKVDAVVLDLNHDDGSESALITAELKRQRASVPVVMLIRDTNALAEGATAQADTVILKSEEAKALHRALRSLVRT